MADEKDPASSAPPKYSRYRSQRQAAKVRATQVEAPTPPEQNEPQQDLGRTKSMSRYRRSRVVPKTEPLNSAPMPPMPSVPRSHTLSPASRGSPANSWESGTRRVTDPTSSPQKQAYDRLEGRQPSQGRPRETEQERARRKARELQEQEHRERKALREQEERDRRHQQQQAEAEAEEARRIEEENTRKLAEQKRKDLERLQAELDAAVPNGMPVTSPKEKFKFFSRKRSSTRITPPPPSVKSGSGAPSLSRTQSVDVPQKGIERGGGGIVPQIDAPISASNAGERRVLIRCKQSSINLPITPETTPVDLIYSAANIMSQTITPASAILLESYTPLGLERRIRRHEHIRDVMNSWDRDTQNALILQNSDSPKFDTDLEASSVPREAPPAVTVHMYHSQKPGKWNKRYITLQSSGQVYIAKKSGAKPSDKDVINICHLSDFDIYTATPQQIRKVLKPPKKHCYAVKSQQKTTMFLSTENFVHFFCTDDEPLADKWYAAVQQWRSWYLVHKLGEGKKAQTKKVAEITARPKPGTRGGPTHTVKVSVDESPYTIGSFTPLGLTLDRFDSHSPNDDDEYDSEEENRPRQIPFHLRNSVSAGALPQKESSRRHPPPVNYRLPPEAEEEFASTGLLGRTYSQRQRMVKEKETTQNNPLGPFVDGPSLLNREAVPHHRTMSMKSTRTTHRPQTSGENTSGLQRGLTQKPKPLLDFTPQFKEAPQWDKTGKGHGVAIPQGKLLVEVATTPDNPLNDIPKSTAVFRRDGGGLVNGAGAVSRPMTAGAAVSRGGNGGTTLMKRAGYE